MGSAPHFLKADVKGSQDLSSAALSAVTTTTKPFRLEEIHIHASQAITETVTITIDSKHGANWDAKKVSRSMVAEQDFVYRPQGEANFQAGDEIKVQVTNANGVGIVYYTIKRSEL